MLRSIFVLAFWSVNSYERVSIANLGKILLRMQTNQREGAVKAKCETLLSGKQIERNKAER